MPIALARAGRAGDASARRHEDRSMTPTELLREAETDLAALAGLPGEIRAKVRAGVAELTRIRDAIDATIASLTGSAGATLASLQALAADAQSAEADKPAPAGTGASFGG
jgi:Tfp pilus assembly protein PilN